MSSPKIDDDDVVSQYEVWIGETVTLPFQLVSKSRKFEVEGVVAFVSNYTKHPGSFIKFYEFLDLGEYDTRDDNGVMLNKDCFKSKLTNTTYTWMSESTVKAENGQNSEIIQLKRMTITDRTTVKNSETGETIDGLYLTDDDNKYSIGLAFVDGVLESKLASTAQYGYFQKKLFQKTNLISTMRRMDFSTTKSASDIVVNDKGNSCMKNFNVKTWWKEMKKNMFLTCHQQQQTTETYTEKYYEVMFGQDDAQIVDQGYETMIISFLMDESDSIVRISNIFYKQFSEPMVINSENVDQEYLIVQLPDGIIFQIGQSDDKTIQIKRTPESVHYSENRGIFSDVSQIASIFEDDIGHRIFFKEGAENSVAYNFSEEEIWYNGPNEGEAELKVWACREIASIPEPLE